MTEPLSEQIPFSHYTDALGEGIMIGGEEHLAILNFRDAITATGRQYQYLELEIDATVPLQQGDMITAREEIWQITEALKSTYTKSKKYTASNGPTDAQYFRKSS